MLAQSVTVITGRCTGGSDERYCRERARLFRKTAEVMANTVSRRLLLDLAEECDDIADDLVRSRFCGASQRLG